MNDAPLRVMDRAGALRHAFDRSFAVPTQIDATPMEDFLAIGVGSEACAIRLSEITGLFVDKKITRVPGRTAALLGIAGFRGTVVPAYDLHVFLGHPMAKTPRWLVIALGAPIALAFEALDGHVRVSRDAILRREAGEHMRPHVDEVVRLQDRVRPIVHLPSVLDVIRRQKSEAALIEE